MTNNMTQTKWADHLRGCAQLSNDIAKILNIRDDAPRQAMFATVVISAIQHHVFVEPMAEEIAAAQLTARDAAKGEGRSAPVIQPEPAAVEPRVTQGVETTAAEHTTADGTGRGDSKGFVPLRSPNAIKDQQAADRADAQIDDVPKTVTPEQSDGQRKTSFLAGIQSARELLNKEGFQPPITPVGLNKIINEELEFPGTLGTLDVDQLETVIAHLSQKLDTFRANKKALEADAPF